jgi:plastocyanin
MITRAVGAAVLAAGLALVPTAPGSAQAGGGATVNVVNMRFSAATVTVPIGGAVTWLFQDSVPHDSESTQGFWSSGTQSRGDTFAHTFGSSGAYPYLCTIHPSMRGVVNVPVSASGTPWSGWSLRWSTAAGAGGTTFDVQIRKPGSSAWKAFRTDTTRPAAKFNPTRSGKYAVRARTTDGGTSGWSPPKALRIS